MTEERIREPARWVALAILRRIDNKIPTWTEDVSDLIAAAITEAANQRALEEAESIAELLAAAELRVYEVQGWLNRHIDDLKAKVKVPHE